MVPSLNSHNSDPRCPIVLNSFPMARPLLGLGDGHRNCPFLARVISIQSIDMKWHFWAFILRNGGINSGFHCQDVGPASLGGVKINKYQAAKWNIYILFTYFNFSGGIIFTWGAHSTMVYAVTRGTPGTGSGCPWPTLCRSSGWRTLRWAFSAWDNGDKASLM